MITKNDRRLGKSIKRVRKQKQLTQEELSNKVKNIRGSGHLIAFDFKIIGAILIGLGGILLAIGN